MSQDHKPELPGESRRILDAGGFIANGRVNGNLNLTRAIGDQDYKRDKSQPPAKQIITCVPEIRVETLAEEDEFVVLACDGIWDVMSNQQVINFIRLRLLPHPSPDAPPVDDGGKLDAEREAEYAQRGAERPPKPRWPGDAQTTVTGLIREVAEQCIDQCLSPHQACGIGCDNMSLTIVLLKGSKFGKKVVEAVAARAATLKAGSTPADPQKEESPLPQPSQPAPTTITTTTNTATATAVPTQAPATDAATALTPVSTAEPVVTP